MNGKYIFLIIGVILFLSSSFTIWLMAREFITERKINNEFSIKSLEFVEGSGEEAYSINKLYEVVDSPPYREIPNLSASHIFITKGGKKNTVNNYTEYIKELTNQDNNSYERTYRFYSNEVLLKEYFGDSNKVRLSINNKVYNTFQKDINLSDSVTLRYGNIGVSLKTNNKDSTEELVIVQKISTNSWELISIDKEGEVLITRIDSINKLRKNPELVKVINYSGASSEAIGYHTQLTQGYPSVGFPILFPLITFIISITLIVIFFRMKIS
ncbi:hypothetical protein AF331_12475 [Rossellomorea marisflavi]|uniref:Uncharacterized protein n=1 Tax=Rossellomorea marisflavi TaxID=189381 RepID=A0A0M0G5K4_9BACI|nr:hypothetical protein [Rossellomorea marisflavi]KON84822.1 hypothetical protein AF331_12475 [Rossellomorea marisflavi]